MNQYVNSWNYRQTIISVDCLSTNVKGDECCHPSWLNMHVRLPQNLQRIHRWFWLLKGLISARFLFHSSPLHSSKPSRFSLLTVLHYLCWWAAFQQLKHQLFFFFFFFSRARRCSSACCCRQVCMIKTVTGLMEQGRHLSNKHTAHQTGQINCLGKLFERANSLKLIYLCWLRW